MNGKDYLNLKTNKMEIIKTEQQTALYAKRLTQFSELRVSKIEDVFSSESLPAIATLRNLLGEPTIKSILVNEVFSVIDFFNVPKMTDGQIAETVLLLMDEFYYLKPEDFKLCFAKAKRGHYGQVYNRVDGQVLFVWLNEYMTERTEYAESLNSRKQVDNETRASETISILNAYDNLMKKVEVKPKVITDEDKLRNAEKQKRAIYEGELIKHFNQNDLEFTEENLLKYRTENPFMG